MKPTLEEQACHLMCCSSETYDGLLEQGFKNRKRWRYRLNAICPIWLQFRFGVTVGPWYSFKCKPTHCWTLIANQHTGQQLLLWLPWKKKSCTRGLGLVITWETDKQLDGTHKHTHFDRFRYLFTK